jgi:hypothetical protein
MAVQSKARTRNQKRIKINLTTPKIDLSKFFRATSISKGDDLLAQETTPYNVDRWEPILQSVGLKAIGFLEFRYRGASRLISKQNWERREGCKRHFTGGLKMTLTITIALEVRNSRRNLVDERLSVRFLDRSHAHVPCYSIQKLQPPNSPQSSIHSRSREDHQWLRVNT